MDINRQKIGNDAETAVCAFLQKHGYKILKRNYHIRGGEVDIIAENDVYTAFVEVRARNSGGLMTGAESVYLPKRKRIIKTAVDFLSKNGTSKQVRFDVAEIVMHGGRIVKLNYIPNAFDSEGRI
ncbi:MAG: YraN family protein [Oscillospiraceae bacterium]|jgi:putative endonuclease|nr:YraN family protein [Oscillospiraceae bacterium]